MSAKIKRISPEWLIDTTVQNICNQDPRISDPLSAVLGSYTRQMKALSPEQQAELQILLATRICAEEDLGSRFLLRLLSDATASILENSPAPYLKVA